MDESASGRAPLAARYARQAAAPFTGGRHLPGPQGQGFAVRSAAAAAAIAVSEAAAAAAGQKQQDPDQGAAVVPVAAEDIAKAISAAVIATAAGQKKQNPDDVAASGASVASASVVAVGRH